MEYIYNERTNVLVEPLLPDGSLIVALHGGYGTPANLQLKVNLEAEFPNSFIIYASAAASKVWKSGAKLSDVSYLHSLVEKLGVDYPSIDLTKVHLFGHSNGGMMCYKLAAVLDEFGFASITVISGSYNADNTFDYAGKVLHFHTANDSVVAIDGSGDFPSIVETIAKVNEVHQNSKFRIESTNLNDTDAHKIDLVFAAFPLLITDIKEHMGL